MSRTVSGKKLKKLYKLLLKAPFSNLKA
jgi:hypothetical protein